ncbi:hypothetical protein ACOJVP_07945, partial [Mycobacterium sp. THU-M116]
AAKLKHLAPDAICVADPLAFTGCARNIATTGAARDRGRGPGQIPHHVDIDGDRALVAAGPAPARNGNRNGNGNGAAKPAGGRATRNGITRAISGSDRPVHPITLWRGRLSVAIDALQTSGDTGEEANFERRSPVETANVQLPSGDRLLVPTGAEALRLKGYLIMCRNTSRDYAEFADMVGTVEPETAALVLGAMDEYYCCQSSGRDWIATQLVRRLADPHPCDFTAERWSGPDAAADWDDVRQRCLSVAVAMLEEAR